MAQRVITTLTDDLDGTEAAETIRFGLDGRDYEIDLSEQNAKALRDALGLFVGVGRLTGKGGAVRKPYGAARAAGASVKPSNPDRDWTPGAVRLWAEANGLAVPVRGRIALTVVEAYLAANGMAGEASELPQDSDTDSEPDSTDTDTEPVELGSPRKAKAKGAKAVAELLP